MATHKGVIDDQSFPSFRADMNNLFLALITEFSFNSQPTITYPFQRWVDTSTSPATIKRRNSANNAWIVTGYADTTNEGMAPTVSPALTGTPTTPTPAAGTSTTQVANCAFVELPTLTWTSMTLLNSHANLAGFQTCQYTKFRGFVFLRGICSRSTSGLSSGVIVANLPAGFRPSAKVGFAQDSLGNPNARFDIDTTGDIAYLYGGTPGAGGITYPNFNGLFFAV